MRETLHSLIDSFELEPDEGKPWRPDQRLFNEAALRSDARIMALPPEFNCKSNYKSVRYEWLKAASPYFYRRLRKDWACCKVPSVGVCAIDHECRFPVL